MPNAFDAISQDERDTLDLEGNGVHIQPGNRFSFGKYTYCSPKVTKIIIGSVAGIVLLLGAAAVFPQKSSSWPPAKVSEDLYAENKINVSHDPVAFKLELPVGTKYMQLTNMRTESKENFGNNNFAEVLHATTENLFAVKSNYDTTGGVSIDITFTHLSVSTENKDDISYYYDGDTDFEAVLQKMVGDTATVDTNSNFEIVNEEDHDNALDALEQQYSLGTTTGLSAMDQVLQISNMKSFLPSSSNSQYTPGDTWDVQFKTDLQFYGHSSLLGYIKYSGVECAVIQVEASVNEGDENSLGLDDDGLDMQSLIVEDGNIKSIILWDVAMNIPRYAMVTISMTTTIGGETDTSQATAPDDDEMVVTMTESIETYFQPR